MNESAPPLPAFLQIGANPVGLEAYLIVAALLFCLGLVACMARRNKGAGIAFMVMMDHLPLDVQLTGPRCRTACGPAITPEVSVSAACPPSAGSARR